jgi:hypothetical protein
MIYQHATSAADRRIADALDQVLGQPHASDQAKRRQPKSGKRRRGMAR